MTPRELVQYYSQIEERVAPALARADCPITAETFCDNRNVRRFFRRLGMIPKGGPKAAASTTLLEVIDTISRERRVPDDRAKAVLAAYCETDGEIAGVCGDRPRCEACALSGSCPFFSRKPTIKELPESERPRERLLALGQENLTDAELLAIIIGGGTEELSAVEVARTLMTRFGSFRQIAECSPGELGRVRGIGSARAAAIKAALEIARRFHAEPPKEKSGAFLNPEVVFARYRDRLGPEKRETFIALLLDAKNRLIRDVVISLGSLTQSVVHPREVFEKAIRDSAASVIFVHNHPSGDTTPSREDIEISKRLKQAGDIIGIRVLDHIIVGERSFTSLAGQGLF